MVHYTPTIHAQRVQIKFSLQVLLNYVANITPSDLIIAKTNLFILLFYPLNLNKQVGAERDIDANRIP